MRHALVLLLLLVAASCPAQWWAANNAFGYDPYSSFSAAQAGSASLALGAQNYVYEPDAATGDSVFSAGSWLQLGPSDSGGDVTWGYSSSTGGVDAGFESPAASLAAATSAGDNPFPGLSLDVPEPSVGGLGTTFFLVWALCRLVRRPLRLSWLAGLLVVGSFAAPRSYAGTLLAHNNGTGTITWSLSVNSSTPGVTGSIRSAGPNSDASAGWAGGDTDAYTMYASCDGGGTWHQCDSGVMTTHTVYFNSCSDTSSGSGPCTCRYHIQWQNTGVHLANFYVHFSGGGTSPITFALPPGGSVDYWITNANPSCASCPDASYGDGGSAPDGSNQHQVDTQDGSTSGISGTAGSGGGDGSGTSGHTPSLSNSVPVVGSPGGSTNGASQGDVFLAGDAIVKAIAGLDTDMNNDFGRLDGIVSTNGGTGNNGPVVQAVTNDVNRLAAYGGTNAHTSGDMLSRVPSSGMSASLATAAASTALGGLDSNVGGSGTAWGSGVTNAAGGLAGGSADGLSFDFCGGTVSFDPETRFPGMMGVIKAAWTFILLVGFGCWAGPFLYGVVHTAATAQTGGVPDLDAELAGFGGNAAGLAVFGAVVLAFIAIWVTALTGLSDQLLQFSSLLPSAGSSLGVGGNGVALYLLNASFPVALFLGLLGARVTIPFASAKVVLLASTASRFLLGR